MDRELPYLAMAGQVFNGSGILHSELKRASGHAYGKKKKQSGPVKRSGGTIC